MIVSLIPILLTVYGYLYEKIDVGHHWDLSCFLLSVWKAKMCLCINWILKLTAQFCYLRLYLGIETVSFCLLPWMARMDMDWNLKKFAQQFPVYITGNAMPTKITKINTLGLCSQMEFTLKIPHNYTGAFCVWVKPLSSDFSTELT